MLNKEDILYLYNLLEVLKEDDNYNSYDDFKEFSKKINYIKEQIDLQDKLMKVQEEITKLNSKETKEN